MITPNGHTLSPITIRLARDEGWGQWAHKGRTEGPGGEVEDEAGEGGRRVAAQERGPKEENYPPKRDLPYA